MFGRSYAGHPPLSVAVPKGATDLPRPPAPPEPASLPEFIINLEDRSPTRSELLDIMEGIEIALSDMVRRWDGDIPAAVRDEMAQPYQLALRTLIRARRRPKPA